MPGRHYEIKGGSRDEIRSKKERQEGKGRHGRWLSALALGRHLKQVPNMLLKMPSLFVNKQGRAQLHAKTSAHS